MPLVVSAIVLILVAIYYLLASISFSYYHFLQVPQLPWLPTFIALHPVLMEPTVAAGLPRRRAVPAAVRPYVRYVAIAGGAISACMLAVELAASQDPFPRAGLAVDRPINRQHLVDRLKHVDPSIAQTHTDNECQC